MTTFHRMTRAGLALGLVATLSACGGGFGGFGGMFSRGGDQQQALPQERVEQQTGILGARRETIWDLFTNIDEPNTTVEVNRYLWQASLEVLDFLPIESVDPFSGLIVTGFGTPPGGGRPYRAAVYVSDPALDARSLNVAILTRQGPASRETVRAVEDAILTRARQIRVRDRGL